MSIRIGVFIPNGAQVLDMACVDVLGCMSKEYLGVNPDLPPSLAALAPNVHISYITTPSQYEQGVVSGFTSNLQVKPTHAYTDEDVAPGRLDIVFVPGPDPTSEYEEGGLEWLAAQAGTEGVDVLSVCTGIYICASAGIADGRRASGPRGLQGDLRKKFPKVRLVGDDMRWVRDGNFWSSGGVTNGNDLVAAYARGCGRWKSPVVDMALLMTDVGDRGQFYGENKHVFMLGAAWNIIKAWFMAIGSGGKKNKQG